MAATNTLLNSSVISNELLRRFINNLKAANLAQHSYDEKFAKGGAIGKIGETFYVRDPVRMGAAKQQAIYLNAVVDKQIPIVCNIQANSGFNFSSRELTMNIDQFGKKHLDSVAVSLANLVDVDLLTMMYQKTPNSVGVPGVVPNDLHTYLEAGEALDRNACPEGERYVVHTPKMNTEIVDGLKGLLQPVQGEKRFLSGRMGKGAGMEWLMDQNCRTLTSGTQGAAPVVNTTVAATQSTIQLGGLTANTGTVVAGEKFTIAGRYAVNPVSGDSYTDLRQFTVTTGGTADAGGLLTVTVYPEINTTAPNKTISSYPTQNDVVVFESAASTMSPKGILAHPEAFQWASVPLEVPAGVHMAKTAVDPDTGISIRMVSQYNISDDIFYTRADIMYGVSAVRPEWACVISS